MNIGWPAAVVIATLIMGVVILIVSRMAEKGSVEVEEAKGKYMEQFQTLSEDYAKLAQETREAQAGMQADLGAVRASVESIEAMMRDVS